MDSTFSDRSLCGAMLGLQHVDVVAVQEDMRQGLPTRNKKPFPKSLSIYQIKETRAQQSNLLMAL